MKGERLIEEGRQAILSTISRGSQSDSDFNPLKGLGFRTLDSVALIWILLRRIWISLRAALILLRPAWISLRPALSSLRA